VHEPAARRESKPGRPNAAAEPAVNFLQVDFSGPLPEHLFEFAASRRERVPWLVLEIPTEDVVRSVVVQIPVLVEVASEELPQRGVALAQRGRVRQNHWERRCVLLANAFSKSAASRLRQARGGVWNVRRAPGA